MHRAENTDKKENLWEIAKALNLLASQGVNVFFPIHPRTKNALKKHGIGFAEGVNVVPAVSYMEMIALEKNAKVILTDSGGVQKEGYFFRVPCVIPRNETEWVELVEAGWNFLAGHDAEKIANLVSNLWKDKFGGEEWHPFYGNGNSAALINEIIKNEL